MSELEQIINNTPNQLLQGWELGAAVSIDKKIKNIIVCGMGGSAMPGRILEVIFKDLFFTGKLKQYIPVIISADYNLPPQAGNDSLILCLSYSGNTEETIAAFKQARERELEIVCLSAGGELKKLALANSAQFIEVPKIEPPRMALDFFIGAILRLLDNSKIIDYKKRLEKTAAVLGDNLSRLKSDGKKLAKDLKGKIPIIYASSFLAPLAMIWKINFNENVKIQAFFNELPEVNHNEMVGFTKLIGNYQIFILRDENDNPRTKKRMELLKTVLGKRKIDVKIIDLEKGELLYKIFSSWIKSLAVTLVLAEQYGIDPLPVEMVEEFKKML